MKKTVNLISSAAMAAVLTLNCGAVVWAADTKADAAEATAEVTTETTAETEESANTGVSAYENGTWEGNEYTNGTLGIQMTFPEEYTIQTGDELNKALGITEEMANSIAFDFLAMAEDGKSGMMFCVEDAGGMDSETYAEMLISSSSMMRAPLKEAPDPVIWTFGDIEFYKQDFVMDYSKIEGFGEDELYLSYLICTKDDMRYYFNANATAETKDEIAEILDTLKSTDASIERTETVVEKNYEIPEVQSTTDGSKFTAFTSVTHEGDEVTEEIFAQADLTMVNIWGTFCSPCIKEMPELGELAKEYADKGVQIVGIIADIEEAGDEIVQMIIDKTGADYTHIVASEDLKKNLLNRTQAVPTTYFVDKEGNIVGTPLEGARDKETWKGVIEEKLGSMN